MNHNPRMVTNTYSKWGVRLGTLALWAAAGASVVFWGLRLSAPAAGPAAPVVLPAPAVPDAQALARLLGAARKAVDGKPAKPFRVGAAVEEGLVLQALGPRQAQLGPDAAGPATLTLDMPLQR